MNVQWYPGHMTKAKRQMQEDIKLIDLIIELVDARVPLSSRNPDIDELGKNKARMILLNKADLADERQNRAWMEYFKEKGIYAVSIDSRNKGSMKAVSAAITEACKEKTERDRRRGIKNRPVRAMVAGIPNVGKSTFINTFAGKACAKTGNKPGVTKGKQWIKLNKNIGSVKDDILNIEELALGLIGYLQEFYPAAIRERYNVEEELKPLDILTAVAKARGCLKKGEELDYEKASRLLLEEFRSGKLGKVTLEFPKGPEEA